MTRQTHVTAKIVNDTALAQEPANPFAGSSLVPMLIAGIVSQLIGALVIRKIVNIRV